MSDVVAYIEINLTLDVKFYFNFKFNWFNEFLKKDVKVTNLKFES